MSCDGALELHRTGEWKEVNMMGESLRLEAGQEKLIVAFFPVQYNSPKSFEFI